MLENGSLKRIHLATVIECGGECPGTLSFEFGMCVCAHFFSVLRASLVTLFDTKRIINTSAEMDTVILWQHSDT